MAFLEWSSYDCYVLHSLKIYIIQIQPKWVEVGIMFRVWMEIENVERNGFN